MDINLKMHLGSNWGSHSSCDYFAGLEALPSPHFSFPVEVWAMHCAFLGSWGC